MTEKQIAILDSALKLFADKGFDAVPTSLIAKEAGVSEGLIFRHFQNKVGLLNAIMQAGKEKVSENLLVLKEIDDPGERITSIMEIPFHIPTKDYPFWRLVYSLKWQNEYYDDELAQPIRNLISEALTEMKYAEVESETELIMSYLDGFATTILLKSEVVDKDKLLKALRNKYKT